MHETPGSTPNGDIYLPNKRRHLVGYINRVALLKWTCLEPPAKAYDLVPQGVKCVYINILIAVPPSLCKNEAAVEVIVLFV